MRSIPQAMFWELWRHGRWHLLAGLLGANVLSVVLFGALRHDGAVNPRDPSQIGMHIVLLQLNALIFGMGMAAAQGRPARLYALPVPTSSLVFWHLLPLIVAVAAESALSTAVLNALFDLGWPLWGPALFAAVAIAAVTALFWLTEDSAWILLGLAVVSGSLGLWFKTRYGEAFSQPTQMWQNVTFTEVVTMLAFAVVAYGVGVIGISRHRRSEPLPSLGVVAALDQLFKLAPYAGPPFRSAFQAHAWFEWRKKGSAMPASVILGLMLGLCGWLLFNRTAQGLTESVLVGGGLLSAVAMICGLIMGNCGATDTTYEIGTFLASRPLTTVEMSRATLRAAAKSVLLSWLIWAAAFFAVYFIVLVVASPMCPFPRGLDWAYVPATLIAAWTVMGLLTSLGLAGRSQWVMVLLCGLPALYIGLALFSKFALSRSGQELFVQCVASATAVAAMLATTWMFVAARRRRLIEWITIYVAASLWVALAALMGIADVWHVWQRPVLYVALVGIGALALAPLAAAPLALAWNRSR